MAWRIIRKQNLGDELLSEGRKKCRDIVWRALFGRDKNYIEKQMWTVAVLH